MCALNHDLNEKKRGLLDLPSQIARSCANKETWAKIILVGECLCPFILHSVTDLWWIALSVLLNNQREQLRENSSALRKTFSTGKYFPSFLLENIFHRFCWKIFSTIFQSLERWCELLKFGHKLSSNSDDNEYRDVAARSPMLDGAIQNGAMRPPMLDEAKRPSN